MAIKKNGQRGRKVSFRGFISVQLNAQEKKHVKDNLLTSEQVVDFIGSATFNGYKVSVSWSKEQDTYTATLYGNRWGLSNAGLAMSFRHRDFITAITALYWAMDQNGWETDWYEVYGNPNAVDW